MWRCGLDLRLVFQREGSALVFHLCGTHDQVQAFLNWTLDLPRHNPVPVRALNVIAQSAIFIISTSVVFPAPTWVSVVPSQTDSRIHEFNTPHWLCVDRDVLAGASGASDRHEMLLFLPGTGGHGRGPQALLETAAGLGYRCVTLMYPDDVAAAEVCRDDPSPDSFEAFRMAIIQGGTSPHIKVEVFDSIESRLARLLIQLRQMRPQEDWGQFLDGKGDIIWERIAVAGQSQGGGHAGLIAVKHRVSRVLMFGAPKDNSEALERPAAWYSERKATPVSRFFAINHVQDRQGCSFRELLQNVHALGMDLAAPVVDVDKESPPYRNARVLVTNYPGSRVDSKTAHGTAIANSNKAVFQKTWIYMLTTQ
jgi:hypothetical protein